MHCIILTYILFAWRLFASLTVSDLDSLSKTVEKNSSEVISIVINDIQDNQ